VSDPLQTITLGQAAALFGGAIVATGAFAKVISWTVSLRREIDSKAPRIDLERLQSETREALDKKASKAEVIAHAATIGEQGKTLAVIQSEVIGLGRRFDELRDMVRQLLDRGAK
jgi:hypothetical protein